MDRRSTAARVLIVSALAVYLIIGTVLTGPAPPIGVLLLVVVLWFSAYRFRHKGLETRELVTKMRTDLRGALEGIEEGLARYEAQRREMAEHEEQAHLDRERRRAEGEKRRASRPAMDPVMSEYAAMIESRVREGERTRRGIDAS